MTDNKTDTAKTNIGTPSIIVITDTTIDLTGVLFETLFLPILSRGQQNTPRRQSTTTVDESFVQRNFYS